jgi:hypothetical protein
VILKFLNVALLPEAFRPHLDFVAGSFVPLGPILQQRDLTRARTAMTRERGREIQRRENSGLLP